MEGPATPKPAVPVIVVQDTNTNSGTSINPIIIPDDETPTSIQSQSQVRPAAANDRTADDNNWQISKIMSHKTAEDGSISFFVVFGEALENDPVWEDELTTQLLGAGVLEEYRALNGLA